MAYNYNLRKYKPIAVGRSAMFVHFYGLQRFLTFAFAGDQSYKILVIDYVEIHDHESI